VSLDAANDNDRAYNYWEISENCTQLCSWFCLTSSILTLMNIDWCFLRSAEPRDPMLDFDRPFVFYLWACCCSSLQLGMVILSWRGSHCSINPRARSTCSRRRVWIGARNLFNGSSRKSEQREVWWHDIQTPLSLNLLASQQSI